MTKAGTTTATVSNSDIGVEFGSVEAISESVVQVRNLRKAYGERWVLNGVSLDVKAGERLALMGPSGSGKSTLLNCIGGVDRADQGSIVVCGQVLETLTSDALAQLRRHRLGTVFQFFHLLPTLTALENVEFPLHLMGVPGPERVDRARALLEQVGVAHRAAALPGELSGGEMQRVAIARALIHRPSVLLADEPTGNLDSVNGNRILALLQELTDATRTAFILVTHSVEAASICHRQLHLLDGEIVGKPSEERAR